MSIRAALKKHILNDMIISTVKENAGGKGSVMLILDKSTSKIISSCLRANELIDNGIIAIESIYVAREAIPTYAAIYFLDNSNPHDLDSTHLMLNDFRNGNQQYQKAYVFYTSTISEKIMDLIIDANIVESIGALVELNINFTTVESRVFTLNDPYPLPIYYWSDKEVIKNHMRSDVNKLVSLCTTLNIKPKIRYDGQSVLSKRFSETLHKQLDQRKRELGSWAPDTRAQMLVLDRGVDVVTPLMHEFTYQAALYDMCGSKGETLYLNNEKLTSEQKINPDHIEANVALIEKNSVVVNESEDPLWNKYRHQHIGIVGTKLASELKSFKKTNKMAKYQDQIAKQRKRAGEDDDDGAQLGQRDDLTTQQMAAALNDFQRFSKEMARFAKHTDLSKEVIAKIDANKLKDIAVLEQELATGFTEDGDSINKKKVVSRLSSLCTDKSVNNESKLRLLLLFQLTQGDLPAQARKELTRDLSPLVLGVLEKLPLLGYAVSSKSYVPPRYSSLRQKEGEARSEEIQLVRYVPLLWELGNLLVLNKLKDDAFPWVAGGADDGYDLGHTTRRGKRGSAAVHDDADITSSGKPIFVIYVIGGITFSEARAVAELGAEHGITVMLGGSVMLTPRQFLCNLADVTRYTWLQHVGPVMGENTEDVAKTAKYMKALYRHSLGQDNGDADLLSAGDVKRHLYYDLDDGYDNVALIGRDTATVRHEDDSILSISEVAEADLADRVVRTNVTDKVRELMDRAQGRGDAGKSKKNAKAGAKAKVVRKDDSDDDSDIEMGMM